MSTTIKKAAPAPLCYGRYQIKLVTVDSLAAAAPNIPAAQAVRGSVWTAETSEKLVKDIKAGLYVPPLVLAGAGDESIDLSDGQQRLKAILTAYGKGNLPGDTCIPVAIDAGRTFAESFAALNQGVPVGKALAAAMGYKDSGTRDAIIRLAAHPLFGSIKWTTAQVQRTSRAEFASAALAICAGWSSPESSTKACNAWLAANAAAITPDVVTLAEDTLTAINAALAPYIAHDKDKGAEGKKARRIMADVKKKGTYMSVVAVGIESGLPMADIVAALDRDDLLTPVTMEEINKATGRKRKVTYQWAVGGGTSGSNADYIARNKVLTHAASILPDAVEVPGERKAAEDAAAALQAEAEDIAATLGI